MHDQIEKDRQPYISLSPLHANDAAENLLGNYPDLELRCTSCGITLRGDSLQWTFIHLAAKHKFALVLKGTTDNGSLR